MQIVLVNVSPDGNKGSCALTWASLDLVFKAFPEASVAIVPIAVTPPEVDPFRHTLRRYPNVEILAPLFDGEGRPPLALLWRLVRRVGETLRFGRETPNRNPTLEWIRKSDLAVSVGGVTFQTYGGTLRDDPRFVIRLRPLIAAQRAGVPSVLIGAHIGPFRTRYGGSLFGGVAAKAALVFPRDHVSAAQVGRRAKKTRSILLPDSAFALEPPADDNNTAALFNRRGLDANAATLALVISSALRPDEEPGAHVALFMQIARSLLASGVVNQVIIVKQSVEDEAISLELAHRLGLDPRCFIDDDLNPGEMSRLYGACRVVVSSRLHAVILAMLSGVPAMSLAPEVTFKEHAVLEVLGLESLCVPTRLGAERVVEMCLEIVSKHERHRKSVVAAVAAAREQWNTVPDRLREIVKRSGDDTLV